MNETSNATMFANEFISIKKYLDAAQDILKTGYMPDITSLEKRVAILCEALQKTDPDIQKETLPALADLLQNLDRCEKAMRSFSEAQLKGESAHGKP